MRYLQNDHQLYLTHSYFLFIGYCVNNVSSCKIFSKFYFIVHCFIQHFAGISCQNTSSKSRKKYSEDILESTPEDYVIDDSQVPKNFLTMHSNSMIKAKKSYIKSLIWRKENKLEFILLTRQNNFPEILSLYPHALHRFSIDGCAVAYELLGRAKPKEMKTKGISSEHLTWHFLLRNELLFQRYLPDGINPFSSERSDDDMSGESSRNYSNSRSSSINSTMSNVNSSDRTNDVPPMGRMMTVLDVKGVSVSDITTDVISFIKQSSEIMDSYYPGQYEACSFSALVLS